MTEMPGNTERDAILAGYASRVEATGTSLRGATWGQAARVARDLARAAKGAETEDLARLIELGFAGEAMAAIVPHGDVERSVAEATGITPRVMRRYRALARCVRDWPDRLVPLLATGSLAKALRLVETWRRAEQQANDPVKPAQAPPPAAPPTFEAAGAILRRRAPSIALLAGAAIDAAARFEAEVARLQEVTSPAAWKPVAEALDVVMASDLPAAARAEFLAGAAMRSAPERTADGTDLVEPAAAAAYGFVHSTMVVTVADAGDGRIASVVANAGRGGAAAMNPLLAVVAPALGACGAEVVCSGTAAAGRVEPDAMVMSPFVVLVSDVEDKHPAGSCAVARAVRHGVVEVSIAGRRVVVGAPSAAALATMRSLGVAPTACGPELNGSVAAAMAVMEDADAPEVQAMFAALWCRDWRWIGVAVPLPDADMARESAAFRHFGLASPERARSGVTRFSVGEGDRGARPM